MSTEPIVIAGAGIGGLTTALALHARGFRVQILDSARELRPLGVGINLLPHAVRELTDLGLGEALLAMSANPAVIDFYRSDGALLFREPRGIEGGYGHPQCSVHRGRLQMLLLDAVRSRLGPDAVHTGTRVTGFTDRRRAVVVHTTAGDVCGTALVGADGIGSRVRAILHPGPDPLLTSGVTMYRGAARMAPFRDGRTMAIIKGANGIDLITYPIGGHEVNWVAQVPDHPPGPLPGAAQWNAPATAEDVLPHLAGWRLDWLDPVELLASTADIFSYPMVDKDPLPHWGRGRVTLLGDAAHPMYPVGANGASQAIVDARVLADHVATDGIAGLPGYEDERRRETADVIAANRDMHGTGAARTADELDLITQRYRTETAESARS
ncbi:hypothetical protein BA059_23975 [Mycolicibacterium sp. (ex Dasyatis americana)]|nr:hypothetical protein BA059_23975 [Mycolicibacterium sp. (ex Dasyatis americana)]